MDAILPLYIVGGLAVGFIVTAMYIVRGAYRNDRRLEAWTLILLPLWPILLTAGLVYATVKLFRVAVGRDD